MEKTVTTPVVKGLIISLILIVFSLVLYFAGMMQNKGLSSLQYLILVGGLIYSCILYANQMDNNVSFGNVFAHGFKTSAVVTVIMILYTVLALSVLFPEMKETALEQATADLAKRNMSDDQIEQAMSISRKFFMTFAIGGILVVFMVVGLISSLIGAAVAKKNPQSPFQQA
jgi:hypothetical protein